MSKTRSVDESDLEWSPGDEREDLGGTWVRVWQVHTARKHLEPHIRDPLRPGDKRERELRENDVAI